MSLSFFTARLSAPRILRQLYGYRWTGGGGGGSSRAPVVVAVCVMRASGRSYTYSSSQIQRTERDRCFADNERRCARICGLANARSHAAASL